MHEKGWEATFRKITFQMEARDCRSWNLEQRSARGVQDSICGNNQLFRLKSCIRTFRTLVMQGIEQMLGERDGILTRYSGNTCDQGSSGSQFMMNASGQFDL